MSAETPELIIVVDTEEEFDWEEPFARENVATTSILAQGRAHDIYDRLGIVPTYVVDYPVATSPHASKFLRRLKEEGRAEIGAHLHPWVTPPHEEVVNRRNSYECNLPPELERAKIAAVTRAIEEGFGERPIVFKAGRYGFGEATSQSLVEFGYKVDCSFVPHSDFSPDGGPNYRCAPDQPFWLDREHRLLEIPVTSGFFGPLAGLAPRAGRLFDSAAANRLRLPGLLARSGAVTRSRITPEGVPVGEQIRLLKRLSRAGHRTFSLTYHSPSLAPGHTPYVRNDADLARFLADIEAVLTFFRDELGGRFTTASAIHAREADALERNDLRAA